jgi:ribosomal protein L9
MSVVTHDVILKRKARRKRRKNLATLRKMRQALARKRIEEMEDDQRLKEHLYDVFVDE